MRFIWIILLALITGGVLLLPMISGQGSATSSNAEELVIISPHWDGIRQEFGNAFEEYARMKLKREVRVAWMDLGGGGEIRKFVTQRAAQVNWSKGDGLGADIFFGGGTFEFDGFIRNETYVKGGLMEPHTPAAEIQEGLPVEVFGQPLKEKEGRWYAACMSGFGFVYNKLVLQRAKLPTPKTWNDLGRPEYQGWVSCGDPTKSGSLLQVMDIIVQANGWDKGWANLAAQTANARAFNEGGSSIPRDVSLGQAAVGPCIDFYAAAPMRRQGATNLEFVFPEGVSIISPDPVGIFRNPPHKELAHAFMDFVLSEAGQRLWYQKRETDGGPKIFDLERLPVRPKIYEMNLPTYTVARPFQKGAAMNYDAKKFSQRRMVFSDLIRQRLIEPHEDLYQAWAAVIKAGKTEQLGPELFKAPMSESEIADVAKKYDSLSATEMNDLKRSWAKKAKEHYIQIRTEAEK